MAGADSTNRSRFGQCGVGRGVAEVARPQRVGHRRHAHRRARVPGVRLLDAVDREGPDGVDREPVELVRGEGHRCLRVARCRPVRTGRASSARTARRVRPRASIVARNAAHTGALSSGPCLTSACHAGRARRSGRAAPPTGPRSSCVGDIVVDVILAPGSRRSSAARDVPGRVRSRQGGRVRGDDRPLARPAGRAIHARLRGRPRRRRDARWSRPRPRDGVTVKRGPRGGRPDRADRRARGAATASARSSRTAAPRSGSARGPQARLVRGRRRRPPPGLLAARRAARLARAWRRSGSRARPARS